MENSEIYASAQEYIRQQAAEGVLRSVIDRELLIRAAMAGFAASGEGFNGECAYDALDRRDEDILESIERDKAPDDFVRKAVERALKLAGLID